MATERWIPDYYLDQIKIDGIVYDLQDTAATEALDTKADADHTHTAAAIGADAAGAADTALADAKNYTNEQLAACETALATI